MEPRAVKDEIYKRMGKPKYMSTHKKEMPMKEMHKMPSGSMMKDKEMKSMKKKMM